MIGSRAELELRLARGDSLGSERIEGCDLDGLDVRGRDLSNVSLVRCSARGARASPQAANGASSGRTGIR